jgi:hypothetical protein
MKAPTVYISKARREDANSEAVVIHCSDHRFQAGFHEFLTGGLRLSSYALQAVPGGGHFVTLEHLMPKFFKVNLQSLSFLLKRTRSPDIVLVGHDDCLFFKESVQYFFTEPEFNQKQIANLKRARKALLERFPGRRVELYFADSLEDGSVEYSVIGQD